MKVSVRNSNRVFIQIGNFEFEVENYFGNADGAEALSLLLKQQIAKEKADYHIPLKRAVEAMEDMIDYVEPYFRKKYEYDRALDEARSALDGF